MARKNKNKTETTTARKSMGTAITLARKAKRVLQSNGLQYFLKWSEKETTGGLRKKSSRGKFKSENPGLYKTLVLKGKNLNRRMDNPKPKEEEDEVSSD